MKRLVLALGLVMALGRVASADPIFLRISDGTTTIDIVDGGAGDLNPANGAITYLNLVIGNWILNVTTGTGSTFNGPSSMHLDSFNVATAPGTLSILFSETGLTQFSEAWTMEFGPVFLPSGAGSATYSAYQSNSNNAFAMDNLIGSLTTGGVLSGLVGGVAGPYSLTQLIEITANGPLSFSANATLTPAPEPATLLLLGAGLLGFGAVARRRFQRTEGEPH